MIKRNDVAKKAVELERLQMALRDNILTPEVKANGFGGVDTDAARQVDRPDRADLRRSRTPSRRRDDIFDPSFLPPAADRKAN